jgi:hypothetical protein
MIRVTTPTGYTGRYLVPDLVHSGAKVRVAARFPDKSIERCWGRSQLSKGHLAILRLCIELCAASMHSSSVFRHHSVLSLKFVYKMTCRRTTSGSERVCVRTSIVVEQQVPPLRYALSKNILPQPEMEPQISPLRFASVEMTSSWEDAAPVFHPLEWAVRPMTSPVGMTRLLQP